MSVPKSVSILWAIGPAWVRRTIEEVLLTAANMTIADLEAIVPLARRGQKGSKSIFAKLVVGSFLHTVNRNDEPQLHVHNVIANTCLGEDGRWSGVNSRLIHQWTPALGRIFRCHLGRQLKKRLGVQLVRPIIDGVTKSWFEVKGVPRKLVEFFSSRRQAIENSLTKSELKDSKKRQRAALATRRNKTGEQDMHQLRSGWKRDAKKHDMDATKVASLCFQHTERQTVPKFEKVFAEVIQSLGREKSHFHESQVISAVCEAYQHLGVDPAKLVKRIRQEFEQSPNVVVLRNEVGNTRLTSRENWELEGRLLSDAKSLTDAKGALVSKRDLKKTLKRHKHLDKEQVQAVKHLVRRKGGMRVLTGVAGAGKSTTLEAVRDAFERSGYQVLGTAIAGKAARELSDRAKIESRTVASYLHHLERKPVLKVADRLRHDVRMLIRVLRRRGTWKHQRVKIPKKAVLVIDEAGMLDTQTLSRLLRQCKKSKATVILTGDSYQLPPILAGGPLNHLAEKTGQANLTVNRRQQDQADRNAVKLVRKGDMEAALNDYASRDRLTVAEDSHAAQQELTAKWSECGGYRKPADHLILTQTRAEARNINRLCQKERMKRGRLLPGLSIKHGVSRFYIGDRVSFHQPMRKHGIENGHSATVMAVDPITRSITVRLDHQPNERKQKMGIGRTQKINLFDLDREAVKLGYASTTHRAQGMTTQHAYVLLTGNMLSQEFTYTQLTRARKQTRIFVDAATAGQDLKELIKAVSRRAKKDLAHDHLSQKQKQKPTKQTLSIERERT